MLNEDEFISRIEQKLALVDKNTEQLINVALITAFTHGAHLVIDFVMKHGDVHIEEINNVLNKMSKGKE